MNWGWLVSDPYTLWTPVLHYSLSPLPFLQVPPTSSPLSHLCDSASLTSLTTGANRIRSVICHLPAWRTGPLLSGLESDTRRVPVQSVHGALHTDTAMHTHTHTLPQHSIYTYTAQSRLPLRREMKIKCNMAFISQTNRCRGREWGSLHVTLIIRFLMCSQCLV